MKKYQHLVYSAVGLAALFLLLVAVNYLVSAVPLRADLTQGHIYTLSGASKKILRGLKAPVKVKLYVSQGGDMPVPLRSFARRVEDMVQELKSVAGPNLVVEKYNPAPDSEAEDAAQLDGIEAQQLYSGEKFYLGVAVSRLDRKQTLAAITPQRERLLEYDLMRAISEVSTDKRPEIGLMAGLPVMGEAFNPYTRQSSDPWVFAQELKSEYDVKQIPLTATAIDKDIDVLLLIHPKDIEPKTEYALDQFVLRGGKLIAFVDPYAYFDQTPTMPGMPPMPSSSTLPTLFKAWGLAMDPRKVVSDLVYASGTGQRYTPTVLSLNPTAFSKDDVVTAQIDSLLYPFGGAFQVKPVPGLKVTDLVESSKNSMLVDDSLATKAGDAATRSFEPGGKPMPLAVRLTGIFKTAFPDGLPAKKGEKASPPPLTQSAKPNSVIVVGDADLLADGAAVDVQDVFGHKVVVPSNGNLAFALGMVEQFAGGDALVGLRTRASAFRPLTVVRELEARAQARYLGKVKALEDELEKTTAKLQALQKSRGGKASAQILSDEEQAEIEHFRKTAARTRLELKEVRRNLRRDAESLEFWTKVANIALMPLLVAIAGLLVAWVRRRRSEAAR